MPINAVTVMAKAIGKEPGGTVNPHSLHFSTQMVYTFSVRNFDKKKQSYGLEKHKSNGRET
jgi:hypothetical protein